MKAISIASASSSLVLLVATLARPLAAAEKVDYAKFNPTPFGTNHPALDSGAVTGWEERFKNKGEKFERFANQEFFEFNMDVPRDQVIGFALYTCAKGQLKLSAQFFPLKQGEEMEAWLEVERDGKWFEIAREPILYPGWSAHFRIKNWDASRDVRYRVRHGEKASFEGLIRHDPVEKDEIVIANMSCSGYFPPNSKPYDQLVQNIKVLNPDLLFFAGDQTYHHTQHTFGWLLWGMQFRDVLRDRPSIAIPDDHDVGHGNLWGDGGKVSKRGDGQDGGYKHPAAYVNMVQRQQSWHLPDPFDPTPVQQGITVYYTSLNIGGVDFAILEDRKFKSPPMAVKRSWGGRYDQVRSVSPGWEPSSIDLPTLNLLGDRQLHFLDAWSRNWKGVDLKVALSQTAFACAATHHGTPEGLLRADLDSNGWPQSGRNAALRLLRRVSAAHLCGDQHLAVVVKHGIDEAAEGPYAMTSPALRNTIFGRWWNPEKPGEDPLTDSKLEFTGNYKDGFGNPIRMLAYANPPFLNLGAMKESRSDGFTVGRFNKKTGLSEFECWAREADVRTGSQFAGWPVRFKTADNDSRKPVAYLPEIKFDSARPVVEVIRESDGETLYVRRLDGATQRLPVFSRDGTYLVKAGADAPDRVMGKGLVPTTAAPSTKPGSSTKGQTSIGSPGEKSKSETSPHFADIVKILDHAIGGPDVEVGGSGTFWRGVSRDEFIQAQVFGLSIIKVGDGAGSNLVRCLRGEPPFGSDSGNPSGMLRRMPAGMAPMASNDIAMIETWINRGCP